MPVATQNLRYPIGKLVKPESISVSERNEAIATLAALPGQLRDAVEGLSSRAAKHTVP